MPIKAIDSAYDESEDNETTMELTPLRSFLVIARLQNMTRAAAELHLTQPAVSSQLAKLEAELDEKLFQRTPRGMVLTEAGVAFLAHAERALREIDAGFAAVAATSGVVRGRLRVGGGATATTYLLPPILKRLIKQHSDVELFVREQGSSDVRRAVADGTIDIGIVTMGGREAAGWHLDEVPWVDDELVLILPPGHPLNAPGVTSFEWADLAETPMVLFESGTAIREMLDQAAAIGGVRLRVAMELRSIESIKRMVRAGIGAGFVSRFALTRQDLGGLPCGGAALSRRLGYVVAPDRAIGSVTSAFIELLKSSPRSTTLATAPRSKKE